MISLASSFNLASLSGKRGAWKQEIVDSASAIERIITIDTSIEALIEK